MPVRRTTVGGVPAYRWGGRGTAYTFDPDDPASRRRALRQAQAQGEAARARGYTGDAEGDPDGTRWRIAEPGAPSSKELQAVLRAWSRRTMRPIYRGLSAAVARWAEERAAREVAVDAGGLSSTEAEEMAAMLRRELRRLASERAPGVPQRQIEAAIERALRVASATQRRHIVRMGADPGLLARAMGIPREDLLALTGPLSESEERTFREWVSGRGVQTPSGERVTGLAKIRTMPQEMVQGLEDWLVPQHLIGRRVETIAKEIEDLLPVRNDRHAMLIARDQIGKLNGAITEATQQAAGITEFVWRSSRDERVRDLHVDLHDTTWRWDDLPESGTDGERLPPGLPIQCRCFARPVLPDSLIA